MKVRYAVAADSRTWTTTTISTARRVLGAFPLAAVALDLLEQGQQKSIRFEAGPGYIDVEATP
jgi:hypothetical protein